MPASISLPAPPESEIPGERPHIPALDGVRGLAILLVLVHHFYYYHGSNRVDTTIARIAHCGWCGVDLFFVLSGFLITGILWDAKGATHYFRSFYVRRVLRIFPLYYGVLLAMLAVGYATGHFEQLRERQFWFWTYLTNVLIARNGWWTAVPGWTIPLWSLAIEEQFYLIWPLVVWKLSRPALMRLCIVGIIFCWGLRICFALMNVAPIAAYVLLPARADTLLTGAFLSLYLRGAADIPAGLRRARGIMIVAGAVLVGIFVCTGELYELSGAMRIMGYTALSALFGGLILRAATRPTGWFGAWLRHPLMRAMGKYSYGIYVLHKLVEKGARRVIERVLKPAGGADHLFPDIGPWKFPSAAGYVFVLVVTCTAAAMVSYHLYEKRFLRLKRFFPYA